MENFANLVKIIAALRSDDGCPWDKAQTLYSMRDSFIEEAYELVFALDNGDIINICEEMGDILLHVVLHSQIAAEEGFFTIDDVIGGISDKIIRRHPHVFGEKKADSVEEVSQIWDEAKKNERKSAREHYLDKADRGLPTLLKAAKLQEAAAKVGFDWKDPRDVFDKIDEELAELKSAAANDDKKNIKEELGDLLFVITNLARHYGFTADEALRCTNDKFVRRFNFVEDSLKSEGKTLQDATLDEMENLWLKAKK